MTFIYYYILLTRYTFVFQFQTEKDKQTAESKGLAGENGDDDDSYESSEEEEEEEEGEGEEEKNKNKEEEEGSNTNTRLSNSENLSTTPSILNSVSRVSPMSLDTLHITAEQQTERAGTGAATPVAVGSLLTIPAASVASIASSGTEEDEDEESDKVEELEDIGAMNRARKAFRDEKKNPAKRSGSSSVSVARPPPTAGEVQEKVKRALAKKQFKPLSQVRNKTKEKSRTTKETCAVDF